MTYQHLCIKEVRNQKHFYTVDVMVHQSMLYLIPCAVSGLCWNFSCNCCIWPGSCCCYRLKANLTSATLASRCLGESAGRYLSPA